MFNQFRRPKNITPKLIYWFSDILELCNNHKISRFLYGIWIENTEKNYICFLPLNWRSTSIVLIKVKVTNIYQKGFRRLFVPRVWRPFKSWEPLTWDRHNNIIARYERELSKGISLSLSCNPDQISMGPLQPLLLLLLLLLHILAKIHPHSLSIRKYLHTTLYFIAPFQIITNPAISTWTFKLIHNM